ncbi:MAG: hypothetical protein SCM96_02300 [Acidobacteriota bacterium]|nr:hypothetical protein [Acidobacteriota bacterium]
MAPLGEFVIMLDRPRRLIFDMKAVQWFREKYPGALTDSGIDPDKFAFNLGDLPPLLKMGLAWEDPGMTEESAANLLNASVSKGQITMIEAWRTTIAALFLPFMTRYLTGTLELEEAPGPDRRGPREGPGLVN